MKWARRRGLWPLGGGFEMSLAFQNQEPQELLSIEKGRIVKPTSFLNGAGLPGLVSTVLLFQAPGAGFRDRFDRMPRWRS
jgi:hypothetical protein